MRSLKLNNIINFVMKVDDSQPTFVEKQDNCQTEISPKTIKEFFDCEQYKLAISGFSTPIILM